MAKSEKWNSRVRDKVLDWSVGKDIKLTFYFEVEMDML